MRKLVLYPSVPRVHPDYSKTPVVVVPNQSMTLQEIIKRFLRKEALPIEKNGVYLEGFGDIEKLARQDIIDIAEHGRTLREKFKQYQSLLKVEEEAKKAVESPPVNSPGPQAPVTGAVVGGQAPPP